MDLHSWCGGASKLRFGAVPGFQGASAIATARIESGETVATLPERLVMSAAVARRRIPELAAHDHAASQQLTATALDRAAVWCLLIHERSLGARSPWAPYIAVLPKRASITTPTLHMHREDVRLSLAGTRLLSAVRRRERVLHDVYSFVVEPLLATDPLGTRFPAATWSRAALDWAAGCFWSRAIRVPLRGSESEAMLPLLDMLNHRPGALSTLSTRCGEVCLTDGVGFAPGEQVCLNYGARSNADLLLNFGFTLSPTNGADVVVVDESELRGELAGVAAPRAARALPDTHLVVERIVERVVASNTPAAAEPPVKRVRAAASAVAAPAALRSAAAAPPLLLHASSPLSSALLDRIRAIAVDVTGCAPPPPPPVAAAAVDDFAQWVAQFRAETEGSGDSGAAEANTATARGAALAPKDEARTLAALRRLLTAMLARNTITDAGARADATSILGMIALYKRGQAELLRAALRDLDVRC